MSKHYGHEPHRNEEWENVWTERLTIIIVFLFLVWMMFIGFSQPRAVDIVPPEHTITEAPTP